MFVNFRSKQELTSRGYDIAGSGFSPLPTNSANRAALGEKFHWNANIIKDLAAIFSSIFTSAIGYGILIVLIAIKLEQNVRNEILMSISAATQIGAGVIFSKFLPSLGQRAGLINSVYIGSAISAFCALLLFFYPGYILWLILIYFLGTSFFICGVTRNTIMIDLAPTHVRAMIISIGTMLVAIGNSLGPIILDLLKTGNSFASFAISCLFFLSSMIPLSRLRKVETNVREEKKITVWRYIKNSPKIMFAGFSISYAMSSASAFLIIYGIKIGMPASEASLLISVLLFGTIFYIPLGYLTDILNRRFLMMLFAFLSLICTCLLYITAGSQQIYILLFLMFGCLSGVKLPAIVLINEKYKPSQRLAVNSAFSRFSLIGNVCGLLCTGIIMKNFGPQGLWLSLMLILLCFLGFCLINYSQKIIKNHLSLRDFSPFNKRIRQ